MTKRLYVYENETVTDSWHSGGGLLIVTGGDPAEAWNASPERPNDAEPLGEPDAVWDVPDDSPDRIMVFPDAGCC